MHGSIFYKTTDTCFGITKIPPISCQIKKDYLCVVIDLIKKFFSHFFIGNYYFKNIVPPALGSAHTNKSTCHLNH